jgi:hypothetical protein
MNSQLVTQLVVILVAAGALGAVLFVTRKRRKKPAWEELAARTTLTYQPRNYTRSIMTDSLKGVYAGRQLVLQTVRGGGELQTLYTRISVQVNNPADYRLSLTPRNVLTRLVRRLGVRYTPVGDEAFDRRFFTLGRPAELPHAVFASPELRRFFRQARPLDIKLSGNNLQLDIRGYETDIDYLHRCFDLICALAASIEHAALPPGR